MAAIQFDARSVAPDTGVADALPAGWYNAMVDETEIKPTKDGAGSYLNTRFEILDGQYKGRKVFHRFNIRNNSAQAQEIAYKQLSALQHALNVLVIQDSTQLHRVPLKIKVKVRAASGDYEASNEISAFKNINEAVGGATGAGAPMQPQMTPPMQMPPQMQQMPQQAPMQQPQQYAPPAQFAQPQAPAQAPQWQPPGQAAQPWNQPAQMPPQQAPQQFQQPVQQPPQPQQFQQPPQQFQQPAQAPQPQFQQPVPQQAPQQQFQGNPQQAIPPWQQ